MKEPPNNMKKKRFKLGENEKEIIRLIGMGALIVSSFAAPNLPSALAGANKKKRYAYKRSFQHIYEKNLIILNGEKVYLSKKGYELLGKIESAEIKIQKSEWDGIWRIVAYDIPDDMKKERDYFRRKLKGLGFKELQKSMLVLPYECKEEIAVFSQNLGISPYVMYLTTDALPRQKEMIMEFGLSLEQVV